MKTEIELEELEQAGVTCSNCSYYDVCKLPNSDGIICFGFTEVTKCQE